MVTIATDKIEAFIQDPTHLEIVGTNLTIKPGPCSLSIEFQEHSVKFVRSGNTMYVEYHEGEYQRTLTQVEVDDEKRIEAV
jgi:hypothetical protein